MPYKTYENYKDSGIEGVGEIPEHWKVLKLKFLINSLESGKRKGFDDEAFAFSVGGEHINWDGSLNFSNKRFISKEFYNSLNKGKIHENDVLLVKDGATIGKTAFVDKLNFKMAVNEHVFILRNNEMIHPKLLYYLISSNYGFSQIKLTETGSAQGGISQDIKNKLYFIIPMDLNEQEHIVTYLDKKISKIIENIAKNKELIFLLEEKKTALINQVVTKGLNPNVPMKDSGIEWIGEIPREWNICRVKNKFNIRSGDSPNKKEDGKYEIFGANGCIGLTDNFNITKKHIIIGRVGAAGSVNITPKKAFVSDNALIIDFNDKFIFNYAYYLFKSLNFDSLISKNAQPLITSTQIKNLFILDIPLNEQEQIASYLDNKIQNIDKFITKIERIIELLEEYKKSLIYHVVTGKINVYGEDI